MRELKELRRQRVFDAYAAAAADPVFMEDMRSTTAAFEPAAADGLAHGATDEPRDLDDLSYLIRDT